MYHSLRHVVVNTIITGFEAFYAFIFVGNDGDDVVAQLVEAGFKHERHDEVDALAVAV